MKKRIAVFCGSSKGKSTVFTEAARELADTFLSRDIGLVYGGGSVGLMGVMADHMMNMGGEVIGVIPKKLYEWEVGHTGITKLHIVDSMHERKALMADLSDAFIAMPGGIGTLDELMEIYTWKQLGYHQKPIGILNSDNYFDMMFTFMKKMVDESFLKQETYEELMIHSDPDTLVSDLFP